MLSDFRRPAFYNAFTKRDVVEEIRYLAVNDCFEGNWNRWSDDEGPPGSSIRGFKGLRELVLLVGGPPTSPTEEICLAFRRDIKRRLACFFAKIAEERRISLGSVGSVPRVKTN